MITVKEQFQLEQDVLIQQIANRELVRELAELRLELDAAKQKLAAIHQVSHPDVKLDLKAAAEEPEAASAPAVGTCAPAYQPTVTPWPNDGEKKY